MAYTTGRSITAAGSLPGPLESLPTMYDLPSEFPEKPGLPDEFHDLQPNLLSRTLSLADYRRENWFTGTDLNVYYDADHPLWHKRPDWFWAVNVPRLLTDTERAEQQAEVAQQQAETERFVREKAQQQAEAAQQQAERLAARLRALGINPEDV